MISGPQPPSLRSWFLPHLEVRSSPIQGLGVFTKAEISEGTIVVVWGGEIVSCSEFRAGKGHPHSNVGVAEGFFLVTPSNQSLDLDDYMNHSCDPNLWLDDEFILVAKRDIEAGEELVFDYAVELCDDSYIMKHDCNCGAIGCRGIVTGEDWKLTIVQQVNAGHFSPFIQKRIDFLEGQTK